MKVFLSWSGEKSKAVARVLHNWLPQVIQAVDPWMSSEMEKGRKWSPEISSRLGETPFGILCLTRDNLAAPWLLFEAGALSKTPDAYVWTFLLGLSPVDVEQPLAQFQHTIAEKSDIRKLIQTINDAVRNRNEKALTESTLDNVFEKFWPDLEAELTSLANAGPQALGEVRRDRDLLEELLELVRSQTHRLDDIAFSQAPINRNRLWTALTQEQERVVERLSIELDVPEINAREFADQLRGRLPGADFQFILTPGTDRVGKILVRFTRAIRSSEGVLWRLLAKSAESAGLTILNWSAETADDT